MKFEMILFTITTITGVASIIHFFCKANNKKSINGCPYLRQQQTFWQKTIEQLAAIFPILLLVFLIRSFLFEPFRIPSGSMRPTLLEGDFILVNKFNYGVRFPVLGKVLISNKSPARGDVLVFRQSKFDVIKRVVGLPGDHIAYRDKTIYVNNHPVSLKGGNTLIDQQHLTFMQEETLGKTTHKIYTYPDITHKEYRFNDLIVPENSYFVMGDNRDNSIDSRMWGVVHDEDIIGQAVAIWLSIDGLEQPWSWQMLSNLRMRWTRLFSTIN
jgi:signal peptidase I